MQRRRERHAALARRVLLSECDVYLPDNCPQGLPLFALELEGVLDAAPRLVLRATRLKNPVVGAFLKVDCHGPPIAGARARPRLDNGSVEVVSDRALILEMTEIADSFRVQHAQYRFVKLDELEILRIEDLPAPARAQADPALAQVSNVLAAPRSRKAGGHGRGAGRGRGGDVDAAIEADVGALDEAVCEDEAWAPDFPVDGSGVLGVADDFGEVALSDGEAGVHAGLGEPSSGSKGPDPLAASALAEEAIEAAPLEKEVIDEMAREAELPWIDPVTKQVHNPLDGAIIGRIKPMHEGTPKECLSIYCRMHQCVPPLRRTVHALPLDALRRWFADGLALPRGKEHRAAHLAIMRALEAEHRGV